MYHTVYSINTLFKFLTFGTQQFNLPVYFSFGTLYH